MWWHLRRIAEYCDSRLPPAESDRARHHLEQCERCRAAVTDFRFAAGVMTELTLVSPPETVWLSLDAALHSASDSVWLPPKEVATYANRRLRLALVALIALIAAGAGYRYFSRPVTSGWQMSQIDRTGSVVTPGPIGALGVGKLLETDAASRFRLSVGAIGTVDVAPNTRLRLLNAGPNEQRLTLERGEIMATIAAPPRIFFVNTPSSTVVDLGCQYTMAVDEGGLGSLHVTVGWASLEWGGRQSLVPAGASCATRPRVGPGTPSFDDAAVPLHDALSAWDFDNAGSRALDVVLAESRARDTLTLWHLLSRVGAADRGRVFDRLAALVPLPASVTREKALRLDAATLELWRQELAWTW